MSFFVFPTSFSPSILWCISDVLFVKRKIPPKPRIISRPLKGWVNTENNGFENPIIQVIPINNAILNISAKASPSVRVLPCLSSGSLFVTIDMNIILSIPSTISSKVIVASANQASIEKNISMLYYLNLRFKFKQVFLE